MSYEALIHNLGFQADPFLRTDADQEERLGDYFIPPPFFNAVLGTPATPSADFIFAPRGGGKTALKKMIETSEEAAKGRMLCVVYNQFDDGVRRLTDVDLSLHLRNIIMRLLVALIEEVRNGGERRLRDESRRILHWLIRAHLSNLQQERFRGLMGAVQLRSDAAKEWWNRITGPANVVVTLLSAPFGITPPMVEKFNQEPLNLGSEIEQLTALGEIARELGYESVYVLVDKVDESDLTANDSAKAFELIQSMLLNLNVLQLRGFGFKFFLWDALRPLLQAAGGRLDRIQPHDLAWAPPQLEEMLRARLRAFSANAISSFGDLCDAPLGLEIQSLLIFFAERSPRNLILLCRDIVIQQSEIDPTVGRLSFEAAERGIEMFARDASARMAAPPMLAELGQIGQIEFTVPYLANDVIPMSDQAARNKVNQWKDRGVVEETGRNRTGETGQPSRLYALKGPILSKNSLAQMSLLEFLEDKVRRCQQCGSYSVRDFDARSEGETCSRCRGAMKPVIAP